MTAVAPKEGHVLKEIPHSMVPGMLARRDAARALSHFSSCARRRPRQGGVVFCDVCAAASHPNISAEMPHDATESGSGASSCAEWIGLEGAAPGPVPCGLLWYTHVGKTGGDSIKHHLQYRAKREGWHFVDRVEARVDCSIHPDPQDRGSST